MKSRTFQIILRILSVEDRVYLETNSVVNASTYGTGSRSAIGKRSGTTAAHYKLPLIHATMLGTNCLATTMKLPLSNIGLTEFFFPNTVSFFFFFKLIQQSRFKGTVKSDNDKIVALFRFVYFAEQLAFDISNEINENNTRRHSRINPR